MAAAVDTRERLLEMAWEVVAQDGPGALTMSALARGAGLSRQAVHLHFPTRAALLGEMARHHDARAGFLDAVAAALGGEPVAGFEQLLRAWCAYLPQILPVARALEAAAASGDAAATAHRERMEDLRRAFGVAIRRIERAGRLRDGWTTDAAADWVWSRSHFTAYHQLVVERGWSPARFSDRLVASLTAELLTPAPC